MPDRPASVDQPDVMSRRAAILGAVRAIPRGEVRSYAEVARAAGWPRHARLVARLLSESEASGLPWHRVLRADGCIAFPKGSPAWLEQARLLRAEGVEVIDGRGRRPAGREKSEATLDAALWGDA
ncbi:MGMT family protein [Aquimonas voraii]|uniref:Methylated-DNA-protein-cysteine methyltransferase related protein n=1 Tax=Aquimonas voraii TaxID=265719 RepID=A0A1G6YY90_9GAMM|nr:MGMT family protein [Aquimonas voraii]SDD95318.1 methylated-DNA-protein-cysteine methyltransferase related protein [Aquimonas voraii]